MDVGDEMYCKKSRDGVEHYLTKGKTYIVLTIGKFSFEIIGDTDEVVGFYCGTYNNHHFNYKDYFYTIREMRKLKLEKINEGRR